MKETVTKRINEVESVTLLYPEIMNDKAKEVIKSLQETIWNLEDAIYKHYDAIRSLEKEVKQHKEALSKILSIADIKYKTVSKEITINTSTFGIRGHGNDIIGRTSKV